MRPVWAKKQTTCRACKKPILKDSKRVDRLVRMKKNNKFLSERFHLECVEEFLDRWYTRHPLNEQKEEKRGRPKLDLTDEQRRKRNQIISSVWGFKKEFQEKLYPVMTKKPGYKGLTAREFRYFKSYNDRLAKIKMKLEELGGIPDSIREMSGHDLSQIASVNPHLSDISGW